MTTTAEHTTNYQAVQRDDPRFDGQFFTAVLTTGIFCRSVCTAQTPRAENVRFFSTAAAAAEAGFRPCLRCRPESAPDPPLAHSVSPAVLQALRLIGEGILDDHGIETLAERLNVSSRHLQRLFINELGTPPIAVAQTRRLLFAKKLIDETNLSMAEVAFSAGYRSVRRFNEAIRQTYGRTPTEIRTKRRRAIVDPDGSTVELRLYYREPYNWPAMLAFLDERATPFVEQVDGRTYRRAIEIDGIHGVIEVQALDDVNAVCLRVPSNLARHLLLISERVKQIFDLRADPFLIDEHLRSDPDLTTVVSRNRGMRIPGVWEGYELAVRALLDVHLGVERARLALGLIVDTFGDERPDSNQSGLTRLFPHPRRLVDASLHALGIPEHVAGAIRSVSRFTRDGALSFDGSIGPDALIERLSSIHGVDACVARYVAMRTLSLPDVAITDSPSLASAEISVNGRDRTERDGKTRAWSSYAAMYRWAGTRFSE